MVITMRLAEALQLPPKQRSGSRSLAWSRYLLESQSVPTQQDPGMKPATAHQLWSWATLPRGEAGDGLSTAGGSNTPHLCATSYLLCENQCVLHPNWPVLPAEAAAWSHLILLSAFLVLPFFLKKKFVTDFQSAVWNTCTNEFSLLTNEE